MVFVWYDYCFAPKDLTGMDKPRMKNYYYIIPYLFIHLVLLLLQHLDMNGA